MPEQTKLEEQKHESYKLDTLFELRKDYSIHLHAQLLLVYPYLFILYTNNVVDNNLPKKGIYDLTVFYYYMQYGTFFIK